MEEKLLPVLGDMTELRLGLSDEEYGFLVENVSVIFHVAASVRFDEPIRDATIMNVRGTREVVQLAKQMKHLKVSLLRRIYLPKDIFICNRHNTCFKICFEKNQITVGYVQCTLKNKIWSKNSLCENSRFPATHLKIRYLPEMFNFDLSPKHKLYPIFFHKPP